MDLAECRWGDDQSPCGGQATGPNPTDRGKCGTKRSVLTDGQGIPVAVVVAGANRHDMKLLADTLDAVVVVRRMHSVSLAFECRPRDRCSARC
jgi:putative transposase